MASLLRTVFARPHVSKGVDPAPNCFFSCATLEPRTLEASGRLHTNCGFHECASCEASPIKNCPWSASLAAHEGIELGMRPQTIHFWDMDPEGFPSRCTEPGLVEVCLYRSEEGWLGWRERQLGKDLTSCNSPSRGQKTPQQIYFWPRTNLASFGGPNLDMLGA